MENKEIYQFSETEIGKVAAKKMLAAYPMIICAIIAALIIVNHLEDDALLKDKNLIYIFAGMTVILLIGGFFSGKKAIVKILRDTKFITDEKSVEKVIPNGKNTHIPFREIMSFKEDQDGIHLKTKDKRLKIPKKLAEFQTLSKNIRSHIHTHVISHATKFKIHQAVINNVTAIGTLALLVGFFVAETKELKLMLGIPLFLFLCVALIKIGIDRKNKQLEPSIIRKAIVFSLVLLVYLIYVIFNT